MDHLPGLNLAHDEAFIHGGLAEKTPFRDIAIMKIIQALVTESAFHRGLLISIDL